MDCIATPKKELMMKIGDFNINKSRCFIIAEIGMNHNGSFENAIKLIDEAKKTGADCAKFQLRHLDEVYTEQALNQAIIIKHDLFSRWCARQTRHCHDLTADHYDEASTCGEANFTHWQRVTSWCAA